eukprot:5761649-Amphidinium_carterae.1
MDKAAGTTSRAMDRVRIAAAMFAAMLLSVQSFQVFEFAFSLVGFITDRYVRSGPPFGGSWEGILSLEARKRQRVGMPECSSGIV